MSDDRWVGVILGVWGLMAVVGIIITIVVIPYMGQLSFGEGDFVILKPGIKKMMTYHLPCNPSSEERYVLKESMVVQIASEPGTNYWFYSTQVLPRCSNCRISHNQFGDAWVDCSLLVQVEMQKED